MISFSNEKWETIERLAARLQAIKNILEVFSRETENQPFEKELNSIREQLEDDFDRTLDALLKVIDKMVYNGFSRSTFIR